MAEATTVEAAEAASEAIQSSGHPHGSILVIGGGIAGLSAITGIRGYNTQVHIVLVEPKDHVEIFWAAYRSLFVPEVAKSSLFSLTKFATRYSIQHIRSTVKQLTLNQAILKDQTVIEFDVCVICTGASNPFPGFGRGLDAASTTQKERLKSLKKHGKSLMDAETLLIIGGGLIACELAGDLSVYSGWALKTTEITIIHSGHHLCPEIDAATGQHIYDKLENMGVKVFLNEKAIKQDDGKWALESNGKLFTADQVIVTGINPVNSFVDSEFLNAEGWIEVDECFQVKKAEFKIFAFGDCCTLLPNTAEQAFANINRIGYNVKTALQHNRADGKDAAPPKLWEAYHPYEVYTVTVGPEDGAFFSQLLTVDMFLPKMKNDTMFLYEAWNKLGLEQEDPPPPKDPVKK